MNFKRISAGALALTMTAALGANALAADKPEGWTPADGARGPMLISARVNYQHREVNHHPYDTKEHQQREGDDILQHNRNIDGCYAEKDQEIGAAAAHAASGRGRRWLRRVV